MLASMPHPRTAATPSLKMIDPLRRKYPKPVPVSVQRGPLPAAANHPLGAECKRHKIRCEFRDGETSCTKCLRSGIKCVVNDFSQKFVDDDGA